MVLLFFTILMGLTKKTCRLKQNFLNNTWSFLNLMVKIWSQKRFSWILRFTWTPTYHFFFQRIRFNPFSKVIPNIRIFLDIVFFFSLVFGRKMWLYHSFQLRNLIIKIWYSNNLFVLFESNSIIFKNMHNFWKSHLLWGKGHNQKTILILEKLQIF